MLNAVRQFCCDEPHAPLYALPTLTPTNLAGDAPWPVPITCCGCPLPQCGVPHKIHSSREQIASIEFQNVSRDSGIGRVFQHSDALAILDFPSRFATELEVIALVVDRP